MTYADIKEVCEKQLTEWLEQAKQNPKLRNTELWRKRVARLQDTAQFPEFESRYTHYLHDLTDTQQRRAYAILGLALTAYQQAGERSKWGFCLRAACEVLQLPHRDVVRWWNEQKVVEAEPEMQPIPDTLREQQQARLLN
jgi:hypothetical protein